MPNAQEWGALGGRTTAARRTPAERKRSSSRAHLASCVAVVISRVSELSDEQVAKLRSAVRDSGPEQPGQR